MTQLKQFFIFIFLLTNAYCADIRQFTTPFALSGVWNNLIVKTLGKADPSKPEELKSQVKLFLESQKIWSSEDGTNWSTVTIAPLEIGAETLSILKVIDPTNGKSLVIKFYNPELPDLRERIANCYNVMTSNFMKMYRASKDTTLPNVITANHLISWSTQKAIYVLEVMDYAPGYELWEVFHNTSFKKQSFKLNDTDIQDILTKFGRSLAAFHLMGTSEEKRQQLAADTSTSGFDTVLHGDANLCNFIYNPDTKSVTMIDTSMMAQYFKKREYFLKDLEMTYWNSRDNVFGLGIDCYNTRFGYIIDGYASHPGFSPKSSESIRQILRHELLKGTNVIPPTYLRHMVTLSQTPPLEDQPGLGQLQEHRGSE